MMKKRKTRKQKIKSVPRYQKQKELKELKQKKFELEREIDEQKRKNTKNKYIKNVKIFGSICNFITPFVIATSIYTGFIKVIGGGFPFVKDDFSKYKKYSLEYQTDGTINMEENYVYSWWFSKSLPSNKLKIYFPWTQDEDGNYSRVIETYSVGKLDTNDLYHAVLAQNINYITENYPNPKKETETTNQNQEQDNLHIIEASLYRMDKSDILEVEETNSDNNIITAINLVAGLGTGAYIAHKREFKLKNATKEIKENYKQVPIEPLQEELNQTRNKILSLTKGGNYNAR